MSNRDSTSEGFVNAEQILIDSFGGSEYRKLVRNILSDRAQIRPLKFVAPQAQISEILYLSEDKGAIEVLRAMYDEKISGLDISNAYENALQEIMGTEEGQKNVNSGESKKNTIIALDWSISMKLLGADLDNLKSGSWERPLDENAFQNYFKAGITTIVGRRAITSVKYSIS